MSDQYLGEIRIFGFNFEPYGWAFCNGQLMPISQNRPLSLLLGTAYGGNGTTTFGLPNLQGLRPVMFGQGTGLSAYTLGQTGGVPTVQLTANQLATHSHAASAYAGAGGQTPGNQTSWSEGSQRGQNVYAPSSPASNVPMSTGIATNTGTGGPHNNLQPYLTLNFCIALSGVWPVNS